MLILKPSLQNYSKILKKSFHVTTCIMMSSTSSNLPTLNISFHCSYFRNLIKKCKRVSTVLRKPAPTVGASSLILTPVFVGHFQFMNFAVHNKNTSACPESTPKEVSGIVNLSVTGLSSTNKKTLRSVHFFIREISETHIVVILGYKNWRYFRSNCFRIIHSTALMNFPQANCDSAMKRVNSIIKHVYEFVYQCRIVKSC